MRIEEETPPDKLLGTRTIGGEPAIGKIVTHTNRNKDDYLCHAWYVYRDSTVWTFAACSSRNHTEVDPIFEAALDTVRWTNTAEVQRTIMPEDP